MCAAVLGQCGPRVPRFKSLFHSQRFSHHNTDHDLILRGDRHGELHSLWQNDQIRVFCTQEIGDDKCQKQQELKQLISAAVEKIYEGALEECMHRKTELEDMVIQSENRLKELIGSTAMQVIASRDLPLQIRLSMNTTRLQEIESARQLGSYGWVGGLVVLVELRHRVASLREMLKLPPIEGFADLEEMLASTTDALNKFCSPDKSSLSSRPAKAEQKSIHQRLQRFYQTLCTIESACQASLISQGTEKGSDYHNYGVISTQLTLQELELKVVRNSKMGLDRFSEDKNSSSASTPNHPFGFSRKRSTSKLGYRTKESSRQNKIHIEEASKLEKLGYQTLKKLEDISGHIKTVPKPPDSETLSPFSTHSNLSDVTFSPSSEITENSSITKGFSTPLSMSPSSEVNGVGTPTSVLPETTSSSSCHILKPLQWTGSSTSFEEASGLRLLSDQDDQSESIDVCWVELYEKDLAKGEESIRSRPLKLENGEVMKTHVDTQSEKASKIDQSEKKENNDSDCSVSTEKWHGVSVTCKHNSSSVAQSKKPLPLPPPGTASASAAPPPPPPPPPPSSLGPKRTQNTRSTKLKKSVTISRLYSGMKKKADGAANDNNPTLGDVATQRRSTVTGTNTRDGMAEALAEITRRSSYFRKIEDDVQKHAECIMELKSGLELFETGDMQKLLEFHEAIEARLEQLTDESQVLAKFEGFPVKKLETVRAAASLYLRMSSLIQQIEDWRVMSPLSEHLYKITTFFEKVKSDVEAIERTKDEDIVRFKSQKITFCFDMIVCIKEAMVGLSSRSLALALRDSQRSKANITLGDEYLSTKDMSKLRANFKMLWRVFQLAFRVHNFAGGHDDKAEQLCCSVSKEMETYPSSFWLELVNK